MEASVPRLMTERETAGIVTLAKVKPEVQSDERNSKSRCHNGFAPPGRSLLPRLLYGSKRCIS
jgi:hypothetical protein